MINFRGDGGPTLDEITRERNPSLAALSEEGLRIAAETQQEETRSAIRYLATMKKMPSVTVSEARRTELQAQKVQKARQA